MKPPTQISEVMTPMPHTVSIDTPLAIARQFLMEKKIRHLPVVEGNNLTGLVTDRDIKLILGPDFAYPEEKELKVGDISLAEPYVVGPETPLTEVVATMAKRRIGSCIIAEDKNVVGIFTGTDACRVLAEVLEG